MQQTTITYGQLDRVLRSLGFVCQLTTGDPPARRYEHHETGALISVPPYPDHERVYSHHLVAARIALEGFGIADPLTFDAHLQKAG